MAALPALVIHNRYRLRGAAEAFITATQALARRVETEGEPGVLSYRFYLHEDGAEAEAVIDYATPEAWVGHHDIAMGWPEMKALHAVAELVEVTFLGPLTPEIAEWLGKSGLRATIRSGFGAAAGFRRPAQD